MDEDEMIEKAKYIRREGAPGNYKYIYNEPQSRDAGVKDNEEVESVAGNVIADIKSGLESGSKDAMARFEKLSAEGKISSNQLQHLIPSLEKYKEKKDSTQNKEEQFFNYVKGKLNKKDGSSADDTFTAKWMATHQGAVEDLRKEYKQKSQSSDLQKAEQTEDQKAKIAKVMREFKEGKLKSSSGEVVKNKEQAIAIALSEAGLSKK